MMRMIIEGNNKTMETLSKRMEESTNKSIESLNKHMESINKKMDDSQKNIESLKEETNKNVESLNKNIESLKEDLQKSMVEQLTKNKEELSKKIDDSIVDSNKKTELISQRIEENNEKLNTKIEEEITWVRREITEVHERCELNQQELQQAKENLHTRINTIEENHLNKFELIAKKQEDLTQAQTNLGTKCEEITATVNDVRDQVHSDKEKMAEVQRREFNNFREEINLFRSQPIQMTGIPNMDNRETINFKTYKKNPMEFIERVEENIARNRETRWSMLDDYFKDVHDNWRTTTRYKIQNYDDFKTLFKAKYWSESTQNIVRDDICNGKYDHHKGTTLTAYFLGKGCMARNLEPKIPEECLVTKLAYNFKEGVARARLNGQIRTIQTMSALLENYEHERYYRRSRQRPDTYFELNGQTSNRNNYRGNYHNPNRSNTDQNPRPTNNGNNYQHNRDNPNCRPNNNNNNFNNNYRPNNGGNQYRPTNNNNQYRPNNNNNQYRPNNNNNHNQGNYRRTNYVRAEEENGGRRFYQGRRSFNERHNQYSQDVRGRESGYDSRRSRSSEDVCRNHNSEQNYNHIDRPEGRENRTPSTTERSGEDSAISLNGQRQWKLLRNPHWSDLLGMTDYDNNQ